MKSEQMEKILSTLQKIFYNRKKVNLPIFEVKTKDLRDYTTTRKDLEKGISKMPLIYSRVYDYDFKDCVDVKKIEEQASQPNLLQIPEAIDDFSKNLQRRSKAYDTRKSTRFSRLTHQQMKEQKEDEGKLLYQRDNTIENQPYSNFRILSLIGKGTFGKVFLVLNSVTDKYYAMKSIRKDVVIEHEALESLHLEKLILIQVDHPFIINMEFVFMKPMRIYFFMDFIQGGELYKHLSEQRRFSEEVVAFYAAQIALGLGYLHKKSILYRDLKLENILLNNDGYILLADFGLAKRKEEEGEDPNSFCGTPEYLSPEMIVGSGHDHTLDWWALGILIYEMIVGIPPFYNKNQHQMFFLIQHSPIRWPDMQRHGVEVSETAQDLITRLLEKDRKKRMGQIDDVNELISHPFFKDINFDKLIKKEITAPFIPKIESPKDLSNFDIMITGEDARESIPPEDGVKKINEKKDEFEKFGFSIDSTRDGSFL